IALVLGSSRASIENGYCFLAKHYLIEYALAKQYHLQSGWTNSSRDLPDNKSTEDLLEEAAIYAWNAERSTGKSQEEIVDSIFNMIPQEATSLDEALTIESAIESAIDFGIFANLRLFVQAKLARGNPSGLED